MIVRAVYLRTLAKGRPQVMVETGPHRFVNLGSARKLGLISKGEARAAARATR